MVASAQNPKAYEPYSIDSESGMLQWQLWRGRNEDGAGSKKRGYGSQRVYDNFRKIQRELLDALVNEDLRMRRLNAHLG